MLQLWLQISLAKFVDDLSISVLDKQNEVAAVLLAAVGDFIDMLENELDLAVSRDGHGLPKGSSIALASHCGLATKLRTFLMKFGIQPESGARNLGVDHYGAGRRLGQSVRTKRIAMMRLRARKLHCLKRAGGKVIKVAKCGLKPAVLYSARCLGLADCHVQALRRVTSACFSGWHKASSMTLRLALHGCDLLHDCVSALLAAWPAAIWDASMDRVRGPAGACIMSARRLGWAWPRYDTFIIRKRLQMRMDEVCPEDVRAMALLDSDAAMWDSWTRQAAYSALAHRPHVEPAARLVQTERRGWTAQQASAVSSIEQGGVWTQSWLHEQGLADSPFCLHCRPPVVGTLRHRFWGCPGVRELRFQAPRTWQHMGEQASPEHLLWSQGLCRDPAAIYAFLATLTCSIGLVQPDTLAPFLGCASQIARCNASTALVASAVGQPLGTVWVRRSLGAWSTVFSL